MLRRWTIPRATGVGIAAGIGALIAATAVGSWPDLRWPYATLLALTGFCGLSILWITMVDMQRRGTSPQMRPIRWFDIVVGAALLLPAGYALRTLAPELGL